MQTIPFRGKIRRVAGTFVVTIPSDYMNNAILPEGIELQFHVERPVSNVVPPDPLEG